MTTVTIEIPEKVEKTLADLIDQLGGKVIATKTTKKKNLTQREKQMLDDLNWMTDVCFALLNASNGRSPYRRLL